jgi:UMF1 family MFS transporter
VGINLDLATGRQSAPSVDRRRVQAAWCVYDWANSSFATIIVTVFLGPYLTTVAKAAADPAGFVHPLGLSVPAGSVFPYAVSLSVLLQVACLPLIGAFVDHSGRLKPFLALFTAAGAGATVGLYGLQGTNYGLGVGLFIVANLAYGAAIICFNAFLPLIAAPAERNRVSSGGWALGYLGAGLLLALALVLVSRSGSFGLSNGRAVRIILGGAGVWWALFALIPLAVLPRSGPRTRTQAGSLGQSLGQLRQTFRSLGQHPQTLLFLIAYLLYADGIHTVTTLASQFGQEALGLPLSTLTTAILIVQFVAFAGALAFGVLARFLGSKPSIILALVVWLGALVYAYAFLKDALGFFILAAVIATVLGGSQALSRSLFSLMIPLGREAEYFSLYELSDRGTSWLGPLLYGLALQFTGSYRAAILSLMVFFLAGIVLMLRLNAQRAIREAGNVVPKVI